MKVILVNGSPEKNGCVNRALEEIGKTLKEEGVESDIFWIGNQVHPCMACGKCKTLGKCIFEDKVNEFLALASQADGFIFGSPVYYSSMAGGMKCFMDRVFFAGSRFLRYKPAAGVVSCRRGGASLTFDELNMYFSINMMPIVSSQYWNMVHGFTPSDVEKDEEGLQTMRVLARNMAWLLSSLQAGKEKGVKMPQEEKHISTNFIK
ncbi:MAG: flavodoxin family protein [Bacilli bacterium]|jgi:multimeric flavodoxin WrbA|nr:flavodoxin family protein [Bacilli bacterium]